RTAARAAPSPGGPPWAPAPEPVRTFGPLPSVPNSALPPGPGIRVPGDVPAVPPGGMLPAPFDVNVSPDPDFTVPSRAAGLVLSGDTAPSAASAASGPAAAAAAAAAAGSAPVSAGPA